MYLTKRQRQILDFINGFISRQGYAPSIEEIGKRFGLSSLATVHKHLVNLEKKGVINRAWNRSRSIELVPVEGIKIAAVELPLLGLIAAGKPIEALPHRETMVMPKEFAGKGNTFMLRVKGDSMIDEQIRDGDYIVVEKRDTATDGETVVALLNNEEVTLKKFYKGKGSIKLVPANPTLEPIVAHPRDVRIQGVVIAVLRKYR
ncbi:MAG: transcriptional repressor LexA [Candidatus Aureabacteria bacterium]|nr:transcriptional repressor LexA [Candidatus Auribacterota bacterium]